MHQSVRVKALGGQQMLHLQQLQGLSDGIIRRKHLLQQQSSPRQKPHDRLARSQSNPHARAPPSRTVEAVLEARRNDSNESTAARFRSKIEEARGSIHTERAERPERHYQQQQLDAIDQNHHQPLVPPLFASSTGMAVMRPLADRMAASPTADATEVSFLEQKQHGAQDISATANRTTVTRRRIGAVRRRNNPEQEPTSKQSTRRRMGKDELEWVEKQLQFTQRVAMLERECESWWRQFYSASGVSSGLSSTMAALIHKGFDELGDLRAQDARQMKQQLHVLRSKLRGVSEKLENMRNGETFYADLQALIEDLEASIAAFRLSQRERYDEYAMDEKALDKELKIFVEKMNDWEVEAANNNSRDRGRAGVVAASGNARRVMARATSRTAFSRANSKAMLLGDEDPVDGDQNADGDDGEVSNESDIMTRVRRLNDLILQSGGMNGGWDDREHRVFTSLLLKYGLTDEVLLKNHRFQLKSLQQHQKQQSNNNNSSSDDDGDNSIDFETPVARFLQRCIKKVVTKSDKAVRCHFIWYLDHLALVQQKKDAISQWKARKEQERQQIIHQGLVEDSTNVDECTDRSPSRQQTGNAGSERIDDENKALLAAKSKAKKDKLLHQWREEKEKRGRKQREREEEIAREKEAREAKVRVLCDVWTSADVNASFSSSLFVDCVQNQRKQELLDAKQKVLLYKLQKEQKSSFLAGKGRSGSHSQPSSSSPGSVPSVSPVPKEDLMERSRQAIEYAKAKWAKLQELEEKRKKQCELPERPQVLGRSPSSTSPRDEGLDGNSSPALLLQSTKASQARKLSKLELRKKDKERRHQNAHDAYIPGAGAIPDVKLKSFGHIPIQPRAVPAWRRNI